MPEIDFTWLQGINLWQVAGVLVVVMAALAFLVKAKPWLFAAVHLLETLGTLADDMSSIKHDMALVKHEVLPNGGSSLKDQATRTETAVGDLAKEVAHVRRQQASTKTTLARTEKTLTEHIATTKE